MEYKYQWRRASNLRKGDSFKMNNGHTRRVLRTRTLGSFVLVETVNTSTFRVGVFKTYTFRSTDDVKISRVAR